MEIEAKFKVKKKVFAQVNTEETADANVEI